MTDNDKLTEDKIFEAATDVFLEKGMDGARMQDIATHAGINKALLHYYYRTKEQLFNKVFETIANRILAKFAPVFDDNLSLDDKIRFFFRTHISFMQENPRLPGFILSEVNRNPERIKRLLTNIEFKRIWNTFRNQHGEELARYGVTDENLPQIMTTLVSLSVFPFAARGILEAVFSSMDIDFDDYIEKRKEFAADFMLQAFSGYKN